MTSVWLTMLVISPCDSNTAMRCTTLLSPPAARHGAAAAAAAARAGLGLSQPPGGAGGTRPRPSARARGGRPCAPAPARQGVCAGRGRSARRTARSWAQGHPLQAAGWLATSRQAASKSARRAGRVAGTAGRAVAQPPTSAGVNVPQRRRTRAQEHVAHRAHQRRAAALRLPHQPPVLHPCAAAPQRQQLPQNKAIVLHATGQPRPSRCPPVYRRARS